MQIQTDAALKHAQEMIEYYKPIFRKTDFSTIDASQIYKLVWMYEDEPSKTHPSFGKVYKDLPTTDNLNLNALSVLNQCVDEKSQKIVQVLLDVTNKVATHIVASKGITTSSTSFVDIRYSATKGYVKETTPYLRNAKLFAVEKKFDRLSIDPVLHDVAAIEAGEYIKISQKEKIALKKMGSTLLETYETMPEETKAQVFPLMELLFSNLNTIAQELNQKKGQIKK